MALAQLRKPVVLSLWGSDLYGPVGPVSRACAPLCDELVVMSEEMQSTLGRPCEVIPDGVDLEKFQPKPQAEARRAVGWDEDDYQILFPYLPERDVKKTTRERAGSSTPSTAASSGQFDCRPSTASITTPCRTT